MQSLSYRLASKELLEQANRELAAGDVRQASEKGWGAAAQMIKAVAEHRGYAHHSHGSLHDVAEQLAREVNDSQIATLFRAAGFLHINFYENWLTKDAVSSGIRDVETFLDKLEPLL